uniref:Uncharacterized protein n=1 Tax=Arundo donax TaxID=35708 RepID=A0A0A9B9Y6_ARUDO
MLQTNKKLSQFIMKATVF